MRCRPHDLPRRLILSLSLVRDLPKQVVFGPSEICRLNDDNRPHPVHARQLERRAEPAVARRRFCERHLRHT
jgi:hypothetical protein